MARKVFYTAAVFFFAWGFLYCCPEKSKPQAGGVSVTVYDTESKKMVAREQVVKTEDEWKKSLTAVQFDILRKKGTERAFTGEYDKLYEKGTYRCAGCGTDLFHSEDKFNSGTGWPSFTRPVAPENVTEKSDRSLFTERTEILCPVCGGHLGHVFGDGPAPTGKRYCMNSGALDFKKK